MSNADIKETLKETIYSYTREQAIEDGVLIDISGTAEAKEAGFKIPVCLTASVHALVEVPESLKGLQDYKGRLWDVCWMATLAFRGRKDDNPTIPFKCSFMLENRKVKTFLLWLVFNASEGFTIMMPEVINNLKRKEQVMSKETEPGKCPKCGSDGIKYGDTKLDDWMLGYEAICKDCGCDFIEWYCLEYTDSVIKA
jgi:hypothetical protein